MAALTTSEAVQSDSHPTCLYSTHNLTPPVGQISTNQGDTGRVTKTTSDNPVLKSLNRVTPTSYTRLFSGRDCDPAPNSENLEQELHPCERCHGTGEVEGQIPNRFDPDYLDDVPLVCSECDGKGTL